MKLLSALFAVLALSFSIHAHALTDDDSLIFVNALGDGDIKIVKKFVEADATNANYKSFAWTPIQMAANKGYKEVAKLLASSGADINVKLKADVSLLRPFQDVNNVEMVKFLTDLGVKDDGCKELKCFDEPN